MQEHYGSVKARFPGEGRRKWRLRVAEMFWGLSPEDKNAYLNKVSDLPPVLRVCNVHEMHVYVAFCEELIGGVSHGVASNTVSCIVSMEPKDTAQQKDDKPRSRAGRRVIFLLSELPPIIQFW